MARKKKNDDFERSLFGFLATAYVADAVGLLDKGKNAKLTHLDEQYGGELTWQRHVERELGVDGGFVRAMYDLCVGKSGKKEPPYAILFILRGLGVPDAVERIKEVFG